MKRALRRLDGLLMAFLFAIWLASCSTNPGMQTDLAHVRMLGAILDGTLLLLTDKKRYAADDVVTVWMDNDSGMKPDFPDQSFGVQRFHFKESDQRWESVRLFGGVGNPEKSKMKPNSRRMEELAYYLPDSLMAIKTVQMVKSDCWR